MIEYIHKENAIVVSVLLIGGFKEEMNKEEQERRELNKKLMKKTFTSQIKNTFSVSLCKNGLIGGWITIGEVYMVYKTGKVTIPEKYRNFVMAYSDIFSVIEGSLLFLPTVTVKMKNEEEHKFLVFNRRKFLDVLNNKMN